MGDFENAVSTGVKAGATGAAVAGTAAAIGAAAGASLGPFAVIAAPIGAAIGALIGFFVALAGGPSKEELEAAAKANAEMAHYGRTLGVLLEHNAKTLAELAWGTTASMVYAKQLMYQAEQNPTWKPMIDAYIKAVRESKTQPPIKDPKLKKFQDFIVATSKLSPSLAADPMVYLRPPMSEVFGPALKAAGINIADPQVIEMMRGNYHIGESQPRKGLTSLPIRRKSVGVASGGKIAIDGRAFAPTIAPYGVGSFKLFPESTPPGMDWMKGDDTRGQPLTAPWPYGLDADNFAKPPGPLGITTKTKAVAAAGVAGIAAYVLFFL